MPMTAANVEAGRVEFAPAAALFRSLADPGRLAILRLLATNEARVVDLVAEVGLAQATVSAHLACLRDCGLIVSRPVGRSSMFRLARPELHELLSAADAVLAATAGAVARCPQCATPVTPAQPTRRSRSGAAGG